MRSSNVGVSLGDEEKTRRGDVKLSGEGPFVEGEGDGVLRRRINEEIHISESVRGKSPDGCERRKAKEGRGERTMLLGMEAAAETLLPGVLFLGVGLALAGLLPWRESWSLVELVRRDGREGVEDMVKEGRVRTDPEERTAGCRYPGGAGGGAASTSAVRVASVNEEGRVGKGERGRGWWTLRVKREKDERRRREEGRLVVRPTFLPYSRRCSRVVI